MELVWGRASYYKIRNLASYPLNDEGVLLI